VDPAPSVRPGGRPGELGELGILSRIGLQPDIILPTPRTPEDLGDTRRKHRQRTGPGEASRHWVQRDDGVPAALDGYGVKSYKGEDVAQNFKAGQVVGVAEYMLSRGEAVYATTSREPLGKGWVRGHMLPTETQTPEFRGFGCSTKRSAYNAKESIFPRGVEPETEEARARYCKTHGSYEPGQVSKRDYEWPKAMTENKHFRFGIVDDADISNRGAGAKRALTMDGGAAPNTIADTVIGSAMLQQKRYAANDHLGTSRASMQGRLPVPKDQVFGLATEKDGQDAGGLIRGNYSTEEQMPDADLGTCLMPGRRNYHSAVPFGLPSVRSDLSHRVVPSEKRSLTNATNFGDDPGAIDLIFPGKFHHLGLGEEDFFMRRSETELRGVLEGSGWGLSDEDFKDVFQEAVALHGDGQQVASVEALMAAYFTVAGMPANRRGHHAQG